MPNATTLIESLLIPSLMNLSEVNPAAAVERRQRMAHDPTTFVRGSLILHVAWLAAHPLAKAPWVWSIGDAHQGNFATLATGPLNRLGVSPVTYGIADVDDEHPAPWHWDVVRLLASMAVALPTLKPKDFIALAQSGIADYARVMKAATIDDEHAERLDFHGLPEALKVEIESDSDESTLEKFRTKLIDGKHLRASSTCVADSAARTWLLPAIEATLQTHAPSKKWQVVDLAQRTSSGGLASLGRRRWWVLARERNRDGDWVPRILELKECRPSVLSAILPAQPFTPATTGRWTLPMGGDPWQRYVPIGVGHALLRTRCQARTVLDLSTLDAGDRLRLVSLWGQILATAHLTSARGLKLPVHQMAQTVADHASEHAVPAAVLAWELAEWTRKAYQIFCQKD